MSDRCAGCGHLLLRRWYQDWRHRAWHYLCALERGVEVRHTDHEPRPLEWSA